MLTVGLPATNTEVSFFPGSMDPRSASVFASLAASRVAICRTSKGGRLAPKTVTFSFQPAPASLRPGLYNALKGDKWILPVILCSLGETPLRPRLAYLSGVDPPPEQIRYIAINNTPAPW